MPSWAPKSDTALMVMIWLVAATAMIITAIHRGPDMNWDLRNYHFFGGYTLLHGGFERHLFPAQVQTWHNPTLSAIVVMLIQALPPVMAAVALVVIQSLNIPLVFIIAKQILEPTFSDMTQRERIAIPLAALVIGITGPMGLCEIGTSFGDNIISVPLVAALAVLGHAFWIKETSGPGYVPKILPWIVLGGFLAGLSVGLKLAAAVFAPGFALCLLWNARRITHAVALMALFGIAALAGFLITGGYWTWYLWSTTGSPIFPYMNQIFRSPWMDAVSLSDDRFRPHSAMAAVSFFFRTAVGEHPGCELGFRDIRFALFLILLPILLVKRLRGWPLAILVFFSVSTVTWLFQFGIERYVPILEMLSGPLLVLLVGLLASRRYRLAAILVVSLIIILTTNSPSYDHGHWRDTRNNGLWFKVDVPAELMGPNEMFLMLSDLPSAYVIPFFPQDSRFIRMQANLNPSPETLLFQKRQETIAGHSGPLFTYGPAAPTSAQELLLADYGLRRNNAPCLPLHTNIETLAVCPLIR